MPVSQRQRPPGSDQNTDTQIEALQKYGCDRIFQEKISGLSIQRPALDEMLSLLRESDTVVVSRFNRLGRSRDHLIDLIGDFAKRGIIFKALDLGIDSSTTAGKLVIGIFAALAEYDGTGRPAGDDPGEDTSRPEAGQGKGQAHRQAQWGPCGELPESQQSPGKGIVRHGDCATDRHQPIERQEVQEDIGQMMAYQAVK